MTLDGWIQIAIYLAILLLLVKPLGLYMARVLQGERVFLSRLISPLERLFYRLAGVQPEREMTWKAYALAVLVFNLAGLALVYLVQRLQGFLPLNPLGVGAVRPDLAFGAAVSFTSNTNWQSYGGETTMSLLTQMLALTTQNFVSAAVGIAVLAAFIRGLARQSARTLGNFWADLTRTTLYILLPLSLLLALALVSQGVVQTFSGPASVRPVDASAGAGGSEQTVALGPAASQIAIKQLGTNGGGFFNVNSAHPLENPTPLSNLLEMLSILLIPAALTYTFGHMIGDPRQGWAVLAAMAILLVVCVAGAYAAEAAANPLLESTAPDGGELAPGGNMEGKEVRFGIANSALWAVATTAASNGSVNAMHDSLMPLGGLVPMALMQLGEVVFGGVGSGLYGMLVFVIIAVFVAGLTIGRTPEYLGKKIETFEMKMASVLILIPPIAVLGATALAVVSAAGKASLLNPGAHGFSEILYAFSSQANNNGSAFAGLNADVPFYNLLGALAMLIGRYWLIVPTLALAGSLAAKKKIPAGAGTLPTDSPLFVVWLAAIVVVVGALNYIPALALGPVVEHLMLFAR